MEKLLIDYAHKWNHYVLSFEGVDNMIHELKKMQGSILQTRRLKEIGISKFYQTGARILINIGTSHITLLRVENSVAYNK